MKDAPIYSFTMLDDTGSHRLTEHQRLMLHILMETEPDATELYPAGVSQSLVAAIAGEASTSKAQEAPPVVEPDRPANLPGAQAAVAV